MSGQQPPLDGPHCRSGGCLAAHGSVGIPPVLGSVELLPNMVRGEASLNSLYLSPAPRCGEPPLGGDGSFRPSLHPT